MELCYQIYIAMIIKITLASRASEQIELRHSVLLTKPPYLRKLSFDY